MEDQKINEIAANLWKIAKKKIVKEGGDGMDSKLNLMQPEILKIQHDINRKVLRGLQSEIKDSKTATEAIQR